MAVNCYITLSGTTIYPALPVGRENIIIADDRRMLNGQLRRAYRARKYRFTLTLPQATEAEYVAWIVAARAGAAASVTYVDELSNAYTVVVMDIQEDLVRTEPAVEGGASTTGPGFYDLTVVVEEV
jgi:hypothetical protein